MKDSSFRNLTQFENPDRPEPNGAVTDRRIVSFRQDEEDEWVAELECGHRQHVRHTPPWQTREWVLTAEGRAGRLGTVLPCSLCSGKG
jgi:hypothetical protein